MLNPVSNWLNSMRWSLVGYVDGTISWDEGEVRQKTHKRWLLLERKNWRGAIVRKTKTVGDFRGLSSEHSRLAAMAAKTWEAGGELPEQIVAVEPEEKPKAPVLKLFDGGKDAN